MMFPVPVSYFATAIFEACNLNAYVVMKSVEGHS